MIKWLQLGIVSALFFHITAATFTSLGVVLPAMINDLGWGFGEAFLGFSIFAGVVGLVSLAPAWTLRTLGLKATFVVGGLCLIAGFTWIALGTTLVDFYGGLIIAGIGYTQCGPVGAIYLINTKFPEKRGGLIGLYMTIGGLGGLAGPQLATWVPQAFGGWQAHWWVLVGLTALFTLMAALFVDAPREAPDEHREGEPDTVAELAPGASETPPEPAPTVASKVYVTDIDWPYAAVIKTPQFYILVASMTLTLLCGLTMNAAAPSHLAGLGVSAAIIAGALSGTALLNALSRGLGGILSSRIDPKWLLVTALFAEAVGMVALGYGQGFFAIAIFAIGEGYGFGMCLFATTVLLVNYFGPHRNPELLGTLNLITTIAMVGPFIAGWIAEQTGGFASVFYGLGAIMLAMTLAALVMQPPRLARTAQGVAA